MTDYLEVSDDGIEWERVTEVPDPRPDFIRSVSTGRPKKPVVPDAPPDVPESPEIGTCAVCDQPVYESDARIETESGALAHAHHEPTISEQENL